MEDQVTETLRQAIHAAATAEAAKYAGPAWVHAIGQAPPCPRCEGAGFITVQQRKFKSRPCKPTKHTCRECKGYGVDLTAALSDLGLEPKYQRPKAEAVPREKAQEPVAREPLHVALRFRPLEPQTTNV